MVTEVVEVRVLSLTLYGRQVGHLAGFRDGRTELTFTDAFRDDPERPIFTLTTHSRFPNSARLMASPWVKTQKLHPVLSNLLPEGALRELIAQSLKLHSDHEFDIFSHLGGDLPGALIARPLAPEEVPPHLLKAHGKAKAVRAAVSAQAARFSLAGVQMKFSMKEKDGRYNLASGSGELGDWIIKTPSTRHPFVPANEYTAMRLAGLAGVTVPEFKLVAVDKLEQLPQINLPDETWAFAIKRFDRNGQHRIHMEDFAQVFAKYPREKYNAANYENIGSVLYEYSGNALADVQQFARRLLVNILLANGDAHLKNWSLLYPAYAAPTLSPAYDIVTTRAYMGDEREYALNLGRTKRWYEVTFEHFENWSRKADIPWRAIKPHLDEVMERARTLWPEALQELPMDEEHKRGLREHWANLQQCFRV